MKREDAQLILQACRPCDEASGDPWVAEALALANADADLGKWWAREQRQDAEIRRALKTVPVPVDLKARLLARNKVVPLRNEVARTDFPPLVWAMAALLLFFLGLAVTWTGAPPPGNSADFAHDLIAATPLDAHHVDVQNADWAQVKSWLSRRHALADIELPPAIKNAPGLMGCRIMAWRGRPVSMLCFVMEGTRHVDLFVARTTAVMDPPAAGEPRFAVVDEQMTAEWRQGDNVYLMSGKVPEAFLRKCLEPATAAARDRMEGVAALGYIGGLVDSWIKDTGGFRVSGLFWTQVPVFEC